MTRLNLKARAVTRKLPPTHYATLGVAPGAPVEEIHTKYLALAKELHPDHNDGGDEDFKTVALAWGVLKNAELRKRYDAQLQLERRACATCKGAGLVKKSAGFTAVKTVSCKACTGAGYL